MEEYVAEIERPKPHQRTEENHAEITCDTFFEFPLAQVPNPHSALAILLWVIPLKTSPAPSAGGTVEAHVVPFFGIAFC